MKTDRSWFDQPLERRGTDCIKWDFMRAPAGMDVIPMWIADMDFVCAPEIRDALVQRADHPCYGYTELPERTRSAFTAYWKRHHGVSAAPDELILLPCVVSAMAVSLRALTQKGDRIIISTPLYGPFAESIRSTERTLVDCPLLLENGRYTFDFEAIERALRNGAKVYMLCNPHNPAGRQWTRAELQQLIDLLDRYQVFLISDEIHADFCYDAPFVSALTLTDRNLLVLTAPSKTFNIAGLQTAFCICPDPQLRESFRQTIAATGVTAGNVFGLTAAEAAYTSCDGWLAGLLDYLRENRDCLGRLLSEYVPKARLTPLEATYLAWVDLRDYGLTDEEISRRTLQAGVKFNRGNEFGEAGAGFIRINIGCPQAQLTEAIRRLGKALS